MAAEHENTISLDVPTHPNTSPIGDVDDPDLTPGRITHPRAREWAIIFNHHYRMLLAWIEHALLTRTIAVAGAGLALRAFSEMFVLLDVGPLLTTLPRTESAAGRAGAPFELPYTLTFPDLPGDRWSYHQDLIAVARARLDALGSSLNGSEGETRQRIRVSIKAAEEFVAAHANDGVRASGDSGEG